MSEDINWYFIIVKIFKFHQTCLSFKIVILICLKKMKIITVTTIKYYQYFKTCASQHAVTTHVRSRVPDVKLPKKKTIHATKEPYPRVRPCFLTSQRFPDLLLITELHVTIVRLSHGTCSTPLSLCAKIPLILLTKCSTRCN